MVEAVAAEEEEEAFELPPDDDMASDEWSVSSWLGGTNVHRVVAAALQAPVAAQQLTDDPAATLNFIKGLRSRNEVAGLLDNKRFMRTLVDRVWQEAQKLQCDGAATSREIESKFAGSIELEYSGLDTFFGGLEGVVGPPDPKVLEGMRREHLQGPGTESTDPFTTPNYGVETTSEVEWSYVADDDATPERLGLTAWPTEAAMLLPDRSKCRARQPLATFEAAARPYNERLQAAHQPTVVMKEVIAARLYTGPMYVKYNAVLRGLRSQSAFLRNTLVVLCCPKAIADEYTGGTLSFDEASELLNKYTTTLHSINSSIVKLGKLTLANKVYRGIAGMKLPDQFWTPNEFGVRGGVEQAFMSTTTEMSVAMGYASGGRGAGIVIEVQQGMVDRGADISWLSQYPHECEILFGPLTGIEAHRTRIEGSVVVVESSFSVNLMSQTIEQVVAKLQRSHLDLLRLIVDAFRFAGTPRRPLARLEGLQSEGGKRDAEWFIVPANYEGATSKAIQLQKEAYDELATEGAWVDEHGSGVAARMRAVAALCARAGATEAAARLLVLAVAREDVGQARGIEDALVTVHALQTAGLEGAAVEIVSWQDDNSSTVQVKLVDSGELIDVSPGNVRLPPKLRAAQRLLGEGGPPPWPATLIQLAHGVETSFAALAASALLRPRGAPRFAVGSEVLVWDEDYANWREHGRITAIAPRGNAYDVTAMGWKKFEQLPHHCVLRVSLGGAGALLREAAARGSSAIVSALLLHGASPFESADEGAATALQLAARGGHVSICRNLLVNLEDPKAEADAEDLRQMSAFAWATRGRHVSVRRLFAPSRSDKAVAVAERSGLSPLACAAMGGDMPALRAELTNGANVNDASGGGVTALMLASRGNHIEAVRALLKARANVSDHTLGEITALTMAAEEGAVDVAVALVQHGANVNAARQDGFTALMAACLNGHEAAAWALMQQGANVNAATQDGVTALMLACENGHEATTRALMQQRADVNATKQNGHAALMFACQNGHEEAARALMQQGANVNAAKQNGFTALMVACQSGHEATARALMQQGGDVNAARQDGITALMLACQSGHEATAQVLMQQGANVNAAEQDGVTVLMFACQNGHTATARVLMRQGADVNAAKPDGGTVLMVACLNGHEGAVQALMQHGADVNAVRHNGFTALMAASQNGHGAAAQVLMQHGVNVNASEKDGWTALMLACQNGHTAVARALMQQGANVNAARQNGLTALMLACQNGHEQAAWALMQQGGDINAAKQDGVTALMVACLNGHKEAAQALMQQGADVDATASDGSTALVVAIENGHASLAEQLRSAGACTEARVLPRGYYHLGPFCSVGLPALQQATGKVYYELTLLAVGTSPQIGWATPDFSPGGGEGVGDDAHSWGADGARSLLFHDGSHPWTVHWQDGDVVGFAADLHSGCLWFGHGGEWTVAFEELTAADWGAGLYPAISGDHMLFRLSGEATRYPGPDSSFCNLLDGRVAQPVPLDSEAASGFSHGPPER